MEEINNKFSILAEICEKLPYDKKPILVGSGAVEFYTKEPCKSIHIDILVDRLAILPILITMNFTSRGRWLYTKDLSIEVVGESAGGKHVNDVKFNGKVIRVLSIEDLIIDTLKVGITWKSQIDIEQAQALMRKCSDECDRDYMTNRLNDEKIDPELIRFN